MCKRTGAQPSRLRFWKVCKRGRLRSSQSPNSQAYRFQPKGLLFLRRAQADWSATVPVAALERLRKRYFDWRVAVQVSYFLKRFANACFASVGFPDDVSRSITVRAAKSSQLLRAPLFTMRAVIGLRHSKRALGSK